MYGEKAKSRTESQNHSLHKNYFLYFLQKNSKHA